VPLQPRRRAGPHRLLSHGLRQRRRRMISREERDQAARTRRESDRLEHSSAQLTTIEPGTVETASSSPGAKPGYYDVPMLKPPVWKWEIAGYFFLGGLSAGAYLLARMAERFGGRKYRDVTRAGTAIAWGSMLPCTPLLIKDLGDPKRFHYMLRVFKPSSPMN